MYNWLIRPRSQPVRRAETALFSAMALTFVTSLIFLAFPEIDIWFSGLFYDSNGFPLSEAKVLLVLRSLNPWLGGAIILCSILLIVSKSLRQRFQIGLPQALVPLVTYAIGVGLIVNVGLKQHVGRARPRDVLDFGGESTFTRVWEISQACRSNCSFTSGEAAGAMAILTVLAILPPLGRARAPVVFALIAIVASLSLNRIAFGAHFLSDVLLSMMIVSIIGLATTLTTGMRLDRARVRIKRIMRIIFRSKSQPASSRPTFSLIVVFTLSIIGAGCAAVPLERGNTLTSYEGLVPNGGRLTKADYRVSASELAAAKTVFVAPTAIAPGVSNSLRKTSEAHLVANAISRSICFGVSERFQVVEDRDDADIIVSSTLTHIVRTNAAVAGLSTVTSLGASAVSPVPVPRLPFGLGGLAVEAEATTKNGRQIGAMVWAKGANWITTSARASEVGDAYSLTSGFGGDFSKMLVTGKAPSQGFPKLPSGKRMLTSLGGKPKYTACERFGRSPGLKDFAASQLGLPPSWTDKAH